MTQPYPSQDFSHDPLIPNDLNGWTSNTLAVLHRSWRPMAAALAIWGIIPAVGSAVAVYYMNDKVAELDQRLPDNPTGQLTAGETEAVLAALFSLTGVLALVMVGSLVLAYFTSAGWASAMRIALADAAGKPIPSFGEAMKYGARKGLTMWGWYILVTLCVLVGLCLCLLPGMYLAFAFALFAPVVICEGGPAMARSLRLVHKSFGPMLGRILLLVLVVLAFDLAWSSLFALFGSVSLTEFTTLTPTALVIEVVSGYVSGIVVALVLVSGLLVTYAESRAREGSVTSTEQLLAHAPD